MVNYVLKSTADIAAVVANPDFGTISAARKAQMVGQLQAVGGDVTSVLPVLLSQTANDLERSFLRALVTAPDSSAAATVTNNLPSGFSATISSVGTGAAGSLETVLTRGLSVPAIRAFYIAATDEMQTWVLTSSTAANRLDIDNKPDIQRPQDFDAVTNPKVWSRK